MKTRVSIKDCNTYELETLKNSIENSIKEIGGISKFINHTDSVLLKPNLLMAKKPEDSVTTHPAIVEALILILKENNIKNIAVGDSPAIEGTEKVLKFSGIYDVCKKYNIKTVEFKEEKILENKENKIMKRMALSKEALSYDKIINLPKMKTHSFTIFTGAVKNMFGLVPGKKKLVFHMKHRDPLEFCDMLLDLINTVKPCLSIMDGVSGMEGNGPSGGEPRKFNKIIAGEEAIAVDNVACDFLGLKKVPIVITAKKRNLLGSNLEDIEVAGDYTKLKDVKSPKLGIIASARGLFAIARKHIAKYPYVKDEKCISCSRCFEICPADAIKMTKVDNKLIPIFDYKKCIRCYCCHEVCPVKAIDLRKPILGIVR